MALKLAEGVVNEVKAYLNTNIAAKLNALDAEYADGITLDDPAAIYVGEMSLESIPAWPALYVLVDRAEITMWKQTLATTVHDLSVGAIVMEQNTETLRRRLYRYLRAIWELLVAAHFDAGVTFHMAEGANPVMDFSPIWRKAGAQLVAAAELTVGVWIQESV